jgi:hypothetical protein
MAAGGNAPGAGVSQHPVDRLIRELVQSQRAATPDEIERIIERMAAAPFDARPVRVARQHRGLTYQGHTLAARADSLAYHLIQRVVVESQWSYGSTAQQYVADLRQALGSQQARLVLFERRGGFVAATLTPTAVVVPAIRLGTDPKPRFYQISGAGWRRPWPPIRAGWGRPAQTLRGGAAHRSPRSPQYLVEPWKLVKVVVRFAGDEGRVITVIPAYDVNPAERCRWSR